MIKRVMVCTTLIIGLAVQAQAQATTTPLYPDEDIAFDVSEDFVLGSGSTLFIFFQALSTVRVTALSVFGEPIEAHPGHAAYRWWLMETTPDWQTPNGNDDSLFYTGDVHFEDVGLNEYTTDIEEVNSQLFYSDVLKAGSYYRLSFQVSNTGFQIRMLFSFSFTTSDGLLSILGGRGFPLPGPIGVYPQFSITTVPVSMPVDIDIKPGGDPNSWPCKKENDSLPVAILSTESFDARNVDADSVRFGANGMEAAEVHSDENGHAKRHVEDVDKDGLLDMVFHFRFGDTGFSCDDIPDGEKSATLTAVLTGETADGTSIEGGDSLQLVRE